MIAEFNELRDGIINRIIEMMILIACVVIYFCPLFLVKRTFHLMGILQLIVKDFNFGLMVGLLNGQ